MLVKHILQNKGRNIIVCREDAGLCEVAGTLARHRIGALVVLDAGGALAGIISERDLVRALAQDGPAALAQPVRVYMSRQVTTCTECDTVGDLMETMTMGRFRHVPVMDEQHGLVGMVSIGDVVKTHIAETVSEANSLRDYISAPA